MRIGRVGIVKGAVRGMLVIWCFMQRHYFTASVLLKFKFLLLGVPNFSVSITYYLTACIAIYLEVCL